MYNTEETPLLTPQGNQTPPDGALNTLTSVLASGVGGSAASLSLVSQLAMTYDQRGLWLWGPTAAGAFIALFDEIAEKVGEHTANELVKKYIKKTRDGSFFLRYGLLSAMSNLGFNWSLFQLAGILFGGISFYNNLFGKLAAPVLASIPSLVATEFDYAELKRKQSEHLENNVAEAKKPTGLTVHLSKAVQAASSVSEIMGMVLQQNWLSMSSPITPIIFTFMAALGGYASYVKDRRPVISEVIEFLITFFAFNPALAVVLLNECLSTISSKTGEVSTRDFYLVLSSAIFLLVLLNTNSTSHFRVRMQELRQTVALQNVQDIEANTDEILTAARPSSVGFFSSSSQQLSSNDENDEHSQVVSENNSNSVGGYK